MKTKNKTASQIVAIKLTPKQFRAGHAPGHLRDEFGELIIEGATTDIEQTRLSHLSGRLWHCADVMPSSLCEAMELPQGSSYAQGARHLRAMHCTETEMAN